MNGQPRVNIHDLIFGIDDTADDFDESQRDALPSTEGEGQRWTTDSIYVAVPERAINNIFDTEHHLFTEEEWSLVRAIGKLEYHSRYILFRILQRKEGKWFKFQDLRKYISEVGEDGIEDAMKTLSRPLKPEPEPMEADDEIIDLTGDTDDEEEPSGTGPSNFHPQVPASSSAEDELRLDYFCQDEEELSLLDGLRILKVDEIKNLCKIMKIQCNKLTKDQMIAALLNYASKQTTLVFDPSPKSKGKGKAKSRETGFRQTTLPFGAKNLTQNQTPRLRQLMLRALGQSVKVNPYLHTLMIRLHIIWFRSTQFPESLFQPALFAAFKKLTFAEYKHVRDADIWSTRDEYLDYEGGLKVEATIDELLKPEPKAGRVAKTPVPDICQRFVTPGTPGGLDFIRALTTPLRTPGAQTDAPDDEALEFDVIDEAPSLQKARIVKTIFEKHVWPKWKELLSAASKPERERKPGLERFEAGFLYTRIVRKCGQAFAMLKEFKEEKEALDALLNQRLWRRGRRGGWYERRALLQMNYLYKNSDGTKDMKILWEARNGIIEALGDNDTHIVTRPSLIRRLLKVEKMLKLTDEQKVKRDGFVLNELKEPDEVSFPAVRVWDHPDSVKLDWMGKVKGKENKMAGTSITNYFVAPGTAGDLEPKKSTGKFRWTGKSLWQGKDETVNVEARALQHYDEVHGFKGIHSETQILTTLFGLLFWDIIFAEVPGAFETPWQTGPLDIGEDSFYYARQQLIEERLRKINNGEAPTILTRHDELHREKKTCCIGVHWDFCERQDLLEIVECLGGDALSSICRLFCEDYDGRHSGGPDLIVWNPETKECKFVEVKGPGDSLQENQKLWCDALLSAGCAVELCHVLDSTKVNKTPKPRAKRSTTASTSRATKGKARARAASPDGDSDGEEERQLPPSTNLTDDEDAWTPSTEIHNPPPRNMKRRRATVQNDELPVFSTPPHPEETSPAKKRRTI
ncbi:Fanconi-associated nuclease [Mycena sanguinolenta]|uniref:Fanconi-associated nuclease n=1 Tax=Mycena sanguinolenta TaxID=230812 RepID=A0A8H6XZB6_9AGAR|nr:Fanconi-associated nuclease [Mycena sanguinolenta]